MSSIIEAESLTKVYASRQRGAGPLLAVDHISFEVHAAEVFGFLGPNGAGKTTTIRMCTGITKPISGRACIAGFDVTVNPIKAKDRIGVVSDVAGLYGEMSTWDNLDFIGRLHDIPAGKRAARSKELLELFGLYDSRHSRISTFSTGMKKRLAIAAALVHEPEVLFLDEPTTGLDVQSARQIRAMMRELSSHGTTVFLTTHYIEEADQLCQRIAVINRGRIVTVGTPDELKSIAQGGHVIEASLDHGAEAAARTLEGRHRVREVAVAGERLRLYVEDPAETLPLLFDIVKERGLRVISINTARPSLEDAFIRLTGLQPEVMRGEKEPRR